MERKVKEIDFSKLRFAYVVIKTFLENESGEKVLNLKAKIEEDLGMMGDDSYDMIARFVEKFELDYQDFDYEKHFHYEVELMDPVMGVLNLLTLSIWLPLKILELLTFNQLKIYKPEYQKPERETTDMTFKDLLTWYLEGKYATEQDIKYVLAE